MTLSIYLLRHWGIRFALVLGGMVGVLLVFDLMANSQDIITSKRVLLPLLNYALLRLPAIITLILPLAALLATLVSLGQLSMRQESIALMAGGVSPARIVATLLAGGLLLALAEFALVNLLLPDSSGQLRRWSQEKYQGLPREIDETTLPAWFNAGDTLLHAKSASLDGKRLSGITMIERDEAGLIARYLEAETALVQGSSLTLRKVHGYTVVGSSLQEETLMPELEVEMPIRPAELRLLADTVDELHFGELYRLAYREGETERVDGFYRTALHRRLAQPMSIPVLMLLALPILFQLPRRQSVAKLQAVAFATAFVFLVAERVFIAMGEAGSLPSGLAAWMPGVVTAAAMLYCLNHHQRHVGALWRWRKSMAMVA